MELVATLLDSEDYEHLRHQSKMYWFRIKSLNFLVSIITSSFLIAISSPNPPPTYRTPVFQICSILYNDFLVLTPICLWWYSFLELSFCYQCSLPWLDTVLSNDSAWVCPPTMESYWNMLIHTLHFNFHLIKPISHKILCIYILLYMTLFQQIFCKIFAYLFDRKSTKILFYYNVTDFFCPFSFSRR